MKISGSGGGGGASLETWVTGLTIKTGSMYLNANNLYQATADHVAGVAFDPTKFQLIGGFSGAFIFKGEINSNDDFPTVAAVQNGWVYKITANVTDNDVTKTNTGLVFKLGDEIGWDGSTWISLGSILSWDNMTSIPASVSNIPAIVTATKEPNGFVNRTDSTITYDLGNRRVTIGGTFDYYNQGTKYSKAAISEQVVHGTGIGAYYVYYLAGTLTCSLVNTFWDLSLVTPICVILYNGTVATTYWSGPEGIVIEERHGLTMDWATHVNLHYNVGTYVQGSGFAITGNYAVATGSGGLADVSYGVDEGIISDEDISITLAPLVDNIGVGNQYPVFYRISTSTEWRWLVNNIPFLKDGNNEAVYNQLDSTTWKLTPVANGRYFNMYLCATTAKSSSSGNNYKFVWIMGQTEHSTLANAQSENMLSLNLAGLPIQEIAPLWQITMKRNDSYSIYSGKSRIESIRKIVGTRVSISLTFNPQDHNNLANRSTANSHPGTAISTDVTNFGKILTASEVNTQLALDKLDDHEHLNSVLPVNNGVTNVTVASDMVVVDAVGGVATINLFTAVNNTGKTVAVRKKDASTNAVNIVPSGSEKINGLSSLPLTFTNQIVTLKSDGANWYVLTESSYTDYARIKVGTTAPVDTTMLWIDTNP